MAYLYEAHDPLVIPEQFEPRPGATTEHNDARASLELLISGENYQLHQLEPVQTTEEFTIFQNAQLHSLPTAGTILSRPDSTVYAPNAEGRLGDITNQVDGSAHELPGVLIGVDTDVLVLAQRIRQGGRYAVTAALSIDLVDLDGLEKLHVRYGAY